MNIMLEEDRLNSLLEAVKLAKEMGYSSSSSPIGYLLEAGTDLCLKISSLLKEGTKAKRNNPEVRFNYRVSDPLGNPKSFKVIEPSKVFWSPQIAEIFRDLASFFIKVKNGDEDVLDFMSKQLCPKFHTSQAKAEELDEKEQGIKLEIAKIANLAYHRRQKKKRSISKYQT